MLASNAAMAPKIVESTASRRSCHSDASTSSRNVRTPMIGSSGSSERTNCSNRCDQCLWAALGPYVQDENGIEPIDHRTVDRRRNRLAKRAVPRVAHDADDLVIGLRHAA